MISDQELATRKVYTIQEARDLQHEAKLTGHVEGFLGTLFFALVLFLIYMFASLAWDFVKNSIAKAVAERMKT